VVRVARDLHRGTCRPRSGSGSGPRYQMFPKRASLMAHVRQTPGHLIMQGRRIVSSLPVGTHKKVLRRAVSGIFRQKVASSYSPYAVGSLTARRCRYA